LCGRIHSNKKPAIFAWDFFENCRAIGKRRPTVILYCLAGAVGFNSIAVIFGYGEAGKYKNPNG